MAGAADVEHDLYLFDSGATHVLLPLHRANAKELEEAAEIKLRLAAGKNATGYVIRGEVYAPGVSKSLLPVGRICRKLGA